mmetsp:Transcript_47940/g.153637  ORF Transcript_47940/g.153637 Transcript_47940/m.153637 type:complete len:207 (-) Transcript_47940:3921-4541(-)
MSSTRPSSPSQITPMDSRLCSMASSLEALVESSPMNSAWASSRSSVTLPRVNSGPVGSKRSPTWSMSWSQWRGRIAWLRRSVMSGIVFLNESTVSRIAPHTSHALMSRPSLTIRFPMRMATSSISSTLMSRKSPSFHTLYESSHSLITCQMSSRCSSSLAVSAVSLYGGCAMLKMSMPALSSSCRLRCAATVSLASLMTLNALSVV